MLIKLISCENLLFLSILLHQVHAEEGRITCTLPDKRDRKVNTTKTVKLSDFMNKENKWEECYAATKLILEGESTLKIIERKEVERFASWLLHVKELEMCIAVENIVAMEEMAITAWSMKGNCGGPLIRLINNTNLYRLRVSYKLAKNLKSVPDAIRIRGNRKLYDRDLRQIEELRRSVNGNWDLQPVGECLLPMPFTSFETLDRNCTHFYGPLVLEQGVAEMHYDSSETHQFNTEGCIQIEKTELKDITFLKGFSRFRPMRSCTQFIRNNRKLCSKNLNYLNTIFKDIQFSNNGDKFCSSNECIGGQVSKYYLEESLNCSLIFGDLIIANFRGLPSNFKNLRSIETIDGRLIIINNTGLYKFDYLSSLKIVGRSTRKGAAIIVKDNADLSLLALPNLLPWLNKSDKSVELVNNPVLIEDIRQTGVASTTTLKVYTSMNNTEENKRQGSVATGELSPHSDGIVHKTTIFVGVATALTLILMCSLASFFVRRQKTNKLGLPQPPYKLCAKSQEKLDSPYLSTCRTAVRRTEISSGVETESSSISRSSVTEQAPKSTTSVVVAS